jgi:transcriptional regulator with XRE-family HTH domain
MTMLAAVAEQRAQSAARLAQAIEASGKSFEAVAHEAGVSTKTVSRWVNQRHDPSRTTVERMAEALGVDPHWLWEPPQPLGLGHADGDEPPYVQDLRAELAALQQQLADLGDRIGEAIDAVSEEAATSRAQSDAKLEELLRAVGRLRRRAA